jgi:hypothetical protein
VRQKSSGIVMTFHHWRTAPAASSGLKVYLELGGAQVGVRHRSD